MLEINFSELLKQYERNLVDQLRGFGKEKEYLKYWVPGTDNISSFKNLIDALVEGKILNFSVIIDYNQILKENIINFVSHFSNYEQLPEQQTCKFIININLDKYLKLKKEKGFVAKKFSIKSSDYKYSFKSFKSEINLNIEYEKKLLKIKKDFKKNFSDNLENKKDLYLEKIQDFIIYYKIENGSIKEAYHNSKKNISLSYLVDLFLDFCINKNIQEAADHAVIYLEQFLRPNNINKEIKGIILPSHAGFYFDDLNILIRKIYLDYNKRNNLNNLINKHYHQVSNNWINLEYKKKTYLISDLINKFILNYKNDLQMKSVTLLRIENDFKIFIELDDQFRLLQKSKNLLLEIEILLKSLEPALEVFIAEVVDQNKLRLKNSPQKNLLAN